MKKLFTLLTLLVALVTSAWADEVIFSMTSVTNGKTSVASGDTQSITATFNTGSSAEVYNGHADSKEMISKNGQIQIGGSGASYFHATFTTALAAGDVVSCTGDANGTFYLNGTSTKSASPVTFPYTIKSTDTDLIGKTDLYVWKDGGKNFTAFAITRITGTHAPSITQSGTSVTLECATDGATIYYTTDGSEPTTTSATYSTAITLTNSCTVRAFAKKGDDASDIVKKDCYVPHATAVTVLGYNGGTVSGDVWTSTDGEYVLTNNVATRGIGYVDLAGSKDGFKLNHTDSYTLKVSNNIKVTKIVVVGKSWLAGSAGNASTIAFDGFTPASGTFFDYLTDGETYVKTIEFTPSSELGYGASITMRPGNNQLGAYIEIYGTEYAPSVTSFEDPKTWDFTNWSDATKTGVKADVTNWYDKEKTDGTPLDFTEEHQDGRSNKTAVDGTLKFSTTNIAETDGLKYTGAAYSMALMFDLPSTTLGTYHGSQYLWLYGNTSIITIPSVTKGSIIEIGVETHKTSEARGVTVSNSTQTQGSATSTSYQVCKWTVNTAGNITITPSKGLHIYYITLKKAVDGTTITPANDKSTYVTTKALDFSKASPAGLTAYVATAAASGSVTLEAVTTVPAGTPLMLIGTAGTDYTVPAATSASAPDKNMFEAGDGTTTFDGSTFDYILFSDGLFYQIGSGSVPVGKAYLHCTSDPLAAATAPYLTIDFGETTGIDSVKAADKANGEYYNLNGQRVANPTKGLYIINGRKVVIK